MGFIVLVCTIKDWPACGFYSIGLYYLVEFSISLHVGFIVLVCTIKHWPACGFYSIGLYYQRLACMWVL